MQTRDTLDQAIAEDREAAHLRQQLEGLRHEAASARENLVSLQAHHHDRGRGRRTAGGVRPHGGARCRAGHPHRRAGPRARRGGRGPVRRAERDWPGCRPSESRREDVDRRLAQLGDTERPARGGGRGARHRGARLGCADRGRAGRGARRAGGGAGGGGRARARPATPASGPRPRSTPRSASWARPTRGRPTTPGSAGAWCRPPMKHDRIDAAGRLIAAAQDALVDLARELADVESVAGLRADLGISPTARTFDVWFDNLFSDLSVRSSIKDSQAARRHGRHLGARGDAADDGAFGRARPAGGRPAGPARRAAARVARDGPASAAEVDRLDHVGIDEQQRGAEQHHRDRVRDR